MSDSSSTPTDIRPIAFEDEVKRSYLDYAMSVIVSRALPDVRDGLKPVHRRILYGMKDGGYDHNKSFRKSARIVGDVMGKYHPHGDAAIYHSMVRMAQSFSMGLPLVDGQGNFGSMDGDMPAAMRYTEARLALSSTALLDDIYKDTVDFAPNYDGSMQEPTVLPAAYPNLLVNGAGGIAVGMATNIPPHNLGEVIDGCCAYIDNPHITAEELRTHIKGPDFPTGGLILGRNGIRSYMEKGRGSVIMRSRTHIEVDAKNKESIIVTEIPYQVNKSKLLERIAEVVKEKIVEGISDLRDESDRHGVRIVIEIRRDAVGDVVLNQLFRSTALQTSFGANTLALHKGRPEVLTSLDMVQAFLEFREEVIGRRTRFLLNKARNRSHILAGLSIAVAHIDEIIALIRSSKDANEARDRLMNREWSAASIAPLLKLIGEWSADQNDELYRFSQAQAKAILDLKLQRLTALEQDKIDDEIKELMTEIADYLEILGSRERLLSDIRTDLLDIKEKFAVPRRTEILDGGGDLDDEDLIQKEDMIVTVSHRGYIKRVPLETYRAQKRGGRGRSGMSTRDEDFVEQVCVANTHTALLFFTTVGKVYRIKVYKLPLGNPQSLGKALVNLFPFEEGERLSTVMAMPEMAEDTQIDPDNDDNNNDDIIEDVTGETTASVLNDDTIYLMFSTASGAIRRNALTDFTRINASGKIAMKLDDGDALIGVAACQASDDVMLTTGHGKSLRCPVTAVRVFKGRNSTGVRGIRLAPDDTVLSMIILTSVEATSQERDLYIRCRRQDLTETEGLPSDRFETLHNAEQFIMTITQRGYGKQTSAYEYRQVNRGGLGINCLDRTEKTGDIIASCLIEERTQLILITNKGQLIRFSAADIRVAGRVTQGVRVFRLADDERVVSVSLAGESDDDDSDNEAQGEEIQNTDSHDTDDSPNTSENTSPTAEGDES